MASFTYVDRDEQLRGLAADWRKEPALAVDLEMEANLHHYGVHLALVQIADLEHVWLVDPLAINDPSPLVGLFQDDKVQKVFHDVSFDFRILEEVWSCRPRNVFDTKIASLLLGKESISLAGLLESYYGIRKDEHFQRVDWLRRPLTEGMLAYAAGDVAYLLKLKGRLEHELSEKGRLAWANEEFADMEKGSYAVQQKTFQAVKGAKSLSDGERGVLRALFEVREELARKVDRPVFFVIPDSLLVQLARNPPLSEQEWQSVRGVHPVVKRQSFRLVRAVRNARPVAQERTGPVHRRLTPKQGLRVQSLLELRDRVSQRLGVENFVVLTREQAEHYVLGDGSGIRSWQRSLLGL